MSEPDAGERVDGRSDRTHPLSPTPNRAGLSPSRPAQAHSEVSAASQYEIYHPAVTYTRPATGEVVLAFPLVFFGQEGIDSLLEFESSVCEAWSLRIARSKTPFFLAPGSMDNSDGLGYDEVVKHCMSRVTPPKFWDDMSQRGIPARQSSPIVDRWWRKRAARNRSIDLAVEIKRARRACSALRSVFGPAVKRGRSFRPDAHEQHRREDGNPLPFVVAEEWRRLARAVLKLVEFRREYINTPFAQFALAFASLTTYGQIFFPDLGRAVKAQGECARTAMIDGERWALCMRVWSYYVNTAQVQWPYRRIRRLMLRTIMNYEFIKHGRRVASPESVRAWLRRNGW